MGKFAQLATTMNALVADGDALGLSGLQGQIRSLDNNASEQDIGQVSKNVNERYNEIYSSAVACKKIVDDHIINHVSEEPKQRVVDARAYSKLYNEALDVLREVKKALPNNSMSASTGNAPDWNKDNNKLVSNPFVASINQKKF
ncbi:MAG: hypothetical protein WC748_00395 [Legionellales bacterium]